VKRTVEDWLSALEKRDVFKIELGLDRMHAALAQLDITAGKLAKQKIITVAGTNGKGTTVTLLSDLLRQNGARVGSVISPHVFSFNERIQVDLEPISDDDLIESFKAIERCQHTHQLTYFEFATVAALHYFSTLDLDYVVLEVGLGGRLDAVNAIDADLAIITNIEMDHMSWLGDTREAIGREKAGIMRANCPVIYADGDMPQTIQQTIERLDAQLYQYGEAFRVDRSRQDCLQITVSGTQQLEVATLPCADNQIASVFQAYYLLTGVLPKQSDLRAAAYKLQGRTRHVMHDYKHYLFDVAHNEASMVRLIEFIISLQVKGRIHLVFSALADKATSKMVQLLKPYIDEWYVAPIDCPRALDKTALMQLMQDEKISSAHHFDDTPSAFAQAEGQIQQDDLLVVAGSFYLLAELEGAYKRCVN
jgi:dihydrofolate synthase/folylpolyglutamate synthase